MHFSLKFIALLATLFSVRADESEHSSYLVSHDEMFHWLANTKANLTFVGEPMNPLSPRATEATIVTYCSSRIGNLCGGACTVFNGENTCLAAPGTVCLSATNNVDFCSTSNCQNPCNSLETCGVRLDDGFCFTPSTNSIAVA